MSPDRHTHSTLVYSQVLPIWSHCNSDIVTNSLITYQSRPDKRAGERASWRCLLWTSWTKGDQNMAPFSLHKVPKLCCEKALIWSPYLMRASEENPSLTVALSLSPFLAAPDLTRLDWCIDFCSTEAYAYDTQGIHNFPPTVASIWELD